MIFLLILIPVFIGLFIGLLVFGIKKAKRTTDKYFKPLWILWIFFSIWAGLIIIIVYWNKVTQNTHNT